MNDEERDLWAKVVTAFAEDGCFADAAIESADAVIEALRERVTPPAPQAQTATPHEESTRLLFEAQMIAELEACRPVLANHGVIELASRIQRLLDRVRRYRDGPGSV